MTARQRWLNRRNSPFPSAGGLTSTTLSDFGDGAHPVLCFSTSAGFSHPRNRKSCRTQSAPDWRRGRRISPWQSGTSQAGGGTGWSSGDWPLGCPVPCDWHGIGPCQGRSEKSALPAQTSEADSNRYPSHTAVAEVPFVFSSPPLRFGKRLDLFSRPTETVVGRASAGGRRDRIAKENFAY